MAIQRNAASARPRGLYPLQTKLRWRAGSESPKAATKVKRAMHEMKEGKLKSGKSGKPVKSRKQAIAIGLSEARKGGGKVPARRGES